MGRQTPRQQIVWTRQRVGLMIAIVVALGWVLPALDPHVDLELFGNAHDVTAWVRSGVIVLALALPMRRWRGGERT